MTAALPEETRIVLHEGQHIYYALAWPLTLAALCGLSALAWFRRGSSWGKAAIGALAILFVLPLTWYAGEAASKELPGWWATVRHRTYDTAVRAHAALEDWVDMPLFRTEQERRTARVQHSGYGIRCKDLAGADCRCGPFQLMDPFADSSMANQPYRILTVERSLDGCTDAQGMTGFVMMERTGECLLRHGNGSCPRSPVEMPGEAAADEDSPVDYRGAQGLLQFGVPDGLHEETSPGNATSGQPLSALP